MFTGRRCIAAVLMFSTLCASAAQLEQTQEADHAENPQQQKAETADIEKVPTVNVEKVEPSALEEAAAAEVEKVETPQVETVEAPDAEKAAQPSPAQTMNMSEVIALLRQQQEDLAQQRQLLESQSKEIAGLKRELDVLRAPVAETMTQETIVATQLPTGSEAQVLAKADETEEPKTKGQLDDEAGESVSQAQTDDPTLALLTDFKGAWRLPGTDAALAIGGYVKATVVYNYDPLDIKDRFIVGSIPVGEDDLTAGTEAQSSITASQSRLNFDLREPTEVGLLRAFIEGDFAGDEDTYRMRHAFGQWNRVLAGKTWSAFVDTQASPEEVDFEGLNGRINVRQSQVRVMPRLGEAYEFQFSMEDPNPQVQNGRGVTRAPDFVASARFQPHNRLHVKAALLGRQIRAQRELEQGAGVEKKEAWGLTLSGRVSTPRFGDRDSILFQLNHGNGIGRYVNDLSSVGDYDGIFNPLTGELKLFDIIAGYVSWQHWWPGRQSLRSNFTLGAVEVDNPGFVDGDAYKRTLRASANLFWTPTPRIDIGAEYLWGNRKNESGENDEAMQIQLAARYRF
jgi:outer membrane DcaP-like protein